MFTGLVQLVGRLKKVSFQGEAGRLALSARFDAPLQPGESIAVNGACLTMVEQQGETLLFDVLKETFEKTALRDKAPGAPLNLERALAMGDPLGGHLVSGMWTAPDRNENRAGGTRRILRLAAPALLSDMVAKGSVAVDGVSLTLVDLNARAGTLTVHVIPHTWNHTALAALQPGDRVNLETD
jgi:riboflavin synthase